MLQSSWNQSLNLLLSRLTAELSGLPRIAIVGVGNSFRCDDAAGMLVAHALQESALGMDNLLILAAGHAPENRTAELCKFAPDLVLFVDAADMGEQPGAIQLIPEEFIDGMSASTHSLPLSILSHYLALELNCHVILLGIQPGSNEIGETVHADVLQAVDEVVQSLQETFGAQIPI
ncbi:MAG TPA: hydrogenase 3 maturation endopeptidase HyCI [Anaerolineales bacterium]|nr:hydrogenase 3 maturation endopeptidase HyCI [Anaerolineales bacterium]